MGTYSFNVLRSLLSSPSPQPAVSKVEECDVELNLSAPSILLRVVHRPLLGLVLDASSSALLSTSAKEPSVSVTPLRKVLVDWNGLSTSLSVSLLSE